MNDESYPWLILVPRVEEAIEWIDLLWSDQEQLMKEINLISRILRSEMKADKINIAALGNVVSQLHVHCVARYKDDPSWPKPIWGQVPAKEYSKKSLRNRSEQIVAAIQKENVEPFTSRL